MSSTESVEPLTLTTSPFASRAPKAWLRVEAWLERISDYLNPILVKEARQALKSRQFLITFSLLLICGWLWSLGGLAMLREGVYYAPAGRFMLVGYLWILSFPLAIIIPFSAFRSLASEREDGTYELLSITTLSPRQIIGGKLGSAVLQILIYLSALSPCLAFTYLLRGIDILSISVVLFWSFMASVLLSTLGLLFATLTKSRHWQIVLMVAIILGLAAAYLFGNMMVTMMLFAGALALDEPIFWIGQLAAVTAWVGVFGLVFLAATARIMFVSDNRSTRLRVWMVVCHLAMIGWFLYLAAATGGELEALAVYVVIAMSFWWLMGSMMVGERSEISPRVRRSLPQSFLGRVFLTFFQPGPGKGYLFALSNATLVMLFAVGASVTMLQSGLWASRRVDLDYLILFAGMFLCYIAIYTGIARLMLRAMGRVVIEGPVVAFLLTAILITLGILVPFIVQLSLVVGTFGDDYTALQLSNPFWTLMEIGDGNGSIWWNGPLGMSGKTWIMIEAAVVVFLLNLLLAAPEITPVRAPVPVRVQDDDRQLHPQPQAASGPSSPWG